MKQISSTETHPLNFSFELGEETKKHIFRTPSSKIGWIHSITDRPGVKFDITIKDALGRIVDRKINCGNETNKYGELVNLPVKMGEDLEVEISNVKGGKEVELFIN